MLLRLLLRAAGCKSLFLVNAKKLLTGHFPLFVISCERATSFVGYNRKKEEPLREGVYNLLGTFILKELMVSVHRS